jgi:hypothetical protein
MDEIEQTENSAGWDIECDVCGCRRHVADTNRTVSILAAKDAGWTCRPDGQLVCPGCSASAPAVCGQFGSQR